MATTTYEPIQTQTLSSNSATVTFNSISQAYTDLRLIISAKTVSSGAQISATINGDSGSNYSRTILWGSGSSAGSNRDTSATSWNMDYYGVVTTGQFNTNITDLMSYSNTNVYKTMITRAGNSSNGLEAQVALWRNTAAITSITLNIGGGGFATGSTFTLYGIANADIGAKATGGVITYDNTYYYHTFGASGTFTPKQSLTADILVVAGGGSGGNVYGGGGGAGGLLGFASQSLTATGYTVTVGAGGAGYDGNGYGANGGDSQFGALTLVKGGGGGGGNAGGNGATGGSGGGSSGGNAPGTPGSATSGQGFAGGSGNSNGSGFGGGGGGGGAAEAGNTDAIYEGGDGVSTYSSWGLVTGTGQNVSGTVYYAGGGGGWRQYNLTTSAGGLGGGGGSGTTALVNSGGGGQANDPVTGTNRVNGGSGVVIIRYLKA